MTFPLVLASASARRAAILRAMGARFEVRPAEAGEPRTADPVESAVLAARAKHDAARADARNAGAAVLASDTLVSCAGRVLGKPADAKDAIDTLMLLSGRVHHVHTAVAVSAPGDAAPDVFVETAAVRFRPFSRDEAEAYFRVARTLDRAGAYDIDAHGERLVERLVGARSCVMGLPAAPVRAWLLAHGLPAPFPFDESFPPRAAASGNAAGDAAARSVEDVLADALRRVSSEIAPDVARALENARLAEAPGSPAAAALGTILENVRMARQGSVPACQDTGWPTFWFDVPDGTPVSPLREAALAAVRRATAAGFLRLNAITVPGGAQRGDNVGDGTPAIHFRFGAPGSAPRATIALKGGGSENQSRQYSLPDASLDAGRDLEGVRKCLLDAVWRAQGGGCAPGVLGVCIGGDRAGGYARAKEQLLRDLGDASPDPALAALEARVLAEANALGVGPMGLGGRTTLLGVKIATMDRLPASYFVTVAYNCWALRRISVPLRKP